MAGRAKSEKDYSLEEGFKKLETILSGMEKEGVTLEESFELYNRGIEVIRHCNKKVEKIEKQIRILDAQGEEHEFQ